MNARTLETPRDDKNDYNTFRYNFKPTVLIYFLGFYCFR